MLKLNHVSNGQIGLLAQVDVDDPDGPQAMTDFVAALDGRIGPAATKMRSVMGEHFVHLDVPRTMPWLTATQALNCGGASRCGKYKSAYLRKPFTDQQIDAMWAYLGNEKYTDYVNRQALIQVDSYGSAINRPLHQTAARQRDSILKPGVPGLLGETGRQRGRAHRVDTRHLQGDVRGDRRRARRGR